MNYFGDQAEITQHAKVAIAAIPFCRRTRRVEKQLSSLPSALPSHQGVAHIAGSSNGERADKKRACQIS